ncbi:unnamed protein product [Blepharisma stoltei]|uniref:EF-hand domain-containing protein n=1 Tax=Blepharisma stoltei TaxID=1481888 RepID=A0AAU9K6W7_9CILI|nr:unnamed protein product [Blepharisma stoltei]
MGLRKPRLHMTGVSNSDIRTAPETKAERKARLPLYESAYPYHQAQLGLSRVKSLPISRENPFQTQTTFYDTHNKKIKPKEPIARPKTSNLGGENLFTGGDNEPYLKNAQMKANRPSKEEEKNIKKFDKYHKTKEIDNKIAIQETQLVHMDHKHTLEGKVDLKKVADIRRTMRRRYANRTDFRKIFNQWDERSLGVLRPEDVCKMVNKIGIPINTLEARVLVASANQSNTGALNLDEFMQLIFDQDDRLNVDLAALTEENPSPDSDKKLIEMHESAVNQHTKKIQNELKIQLKEKINGLAAQLIRRDKNKTGKVNFEYFANILNNMDLPTSIANEKHWKLLYMDMGGNDEGLNYRDFIDKLNEFDQSNAARLEEIGPPVNPLIQEYNKLTNDTTDGFGKPPKQSTMQYKGSLAIIDRQKAPVNQLDNIFLRARKIRQFLREGVDSQQKLNEELSQAGIDNKVSQEQLKDFVIAKLKEKQTFKITKKELEGFLSSYIYNKDGLALVEDITNNIFMEDTKAAQELHIIKRAVPPYRETKNYDVNSNGNVKRLLKDIEEKMFVQGSQRSLNIFKKFDRDGDGFITKEDLQSALELNNIVHSSEDVEDLMAFLDDGKNGHVGFREFSKHVQPNIIQSNHERLQEDSQKFMNISQPSSGFLKAQMSQTDFFNKAHENLRNQFRPDDKLIQLVSNTRYGSNPPHKDTFAQHLPPVDAGMYASDEERFSAKKFQPLNMGLEDKQKLAQSKDIRLQYIKNVRNDIDSRLSNIQEIADKKENNKIVKRSNMKEEYELRCKLNSPFAHLQIG